MRKLLLPLLGILFLTVPAPDNRAEARDPWSAWKFLVGEWVGEGGGHPGQGTGSFSFTFDLQNRVLVRRNQADYPFNKDRPSYRYEDLIVIYLEPESNRARAAEGRKLTPESIIMAGPGEVHRFERENACCH